MSTRKYEIFLSISRPIFVWLFYIPWKKTMSNIITTWEVNIINCQVKVGRNLAQNTLLVIFPDTNRIKGIHSHHTENIGHILNVFLTKIIFLVIRLHCLSTVFSYVYRKLLSERISSCPSSCVFHQKQGKAQKGSPH